MWTALSLPNSRHGSPDTAVIDVFFHSLKTIRRAFSLSVAVWFVLVPVLLQGVHRHAELPCRAAAAETSVLDQSGRVSCTGTVGITAEPEIENNPQTATGLCPICLFLKNCREHDVLWTSLNLVQGSGRHVAPRATFCHTSPVVLSSIPRAPPVSIS